MLSSVLIFCFAVGLAMAHAPVRRATDHVPEMDQRCLDCICQASSNCDLSTKCHNSGDGGYFCGPYAISWAYWHDAGRPGDHGRAHDFETCLTNKACAEQAVRGYMRKYAQDCDRNGVIDCSDYARMHQLGYGSCGGNSILHTQYWQKFDVCYSQQYDYRRRTYANYN